MSADRLREAAALMRERAEAATSGPWESWSGRDAGGGEYVSGDMEGSGYTFGISPGCAGEVGWEKARTDAEHIASWHPAVALEVAQFLDVLAEFAEAGEPVPDDLLDNLGDAISNAYLGGDA